MRKTIKKEKKLIPSVQVTSVAGVFSEVIKANLHHKTEANAAVFNTLRILKAKNPGDTYYEEYLKHLAKRPGEFFDYYHLLWSVVGPSQPKNIMEIGCRTGISICQLMSALPDPSIPNVYLFDVFNDGFISPELVKMNMKALNLPTEKVEFIIGSSLETVPAFLKERLRQVSVHIDVPGMDYILVDGDHNKGPARQDLENVIPLLNSAGLLFFDDIAPDGCNLIDVWNDFKKAHAEEFFFHENLDGKGIGVGVKK